MPWVGLEPTIQAAERAKTVHALDRSATVTGPEKNRSPNFLSVQFEISLQSEKSETLVCMRNEVSKTIKFERLQCWY
jgi:hypothetical protein